MKIYLAIALLSLALNLVYGYEVSSVLRGAQPRTTMAAHVKILR